MKKFGSKAGFTLVELIVVIAILGILAGIAVPAYSGYIKKANEAADYAQLDAVKTAAVFAYVDAVINDADTTNDDKINVTSIEYTCGTNNSVKVTGAAGEKNVNITAYYTGNADTFKVFESANWTASTGKWTPTNK